MKPARPSKRGRFDTWNRRMDRLGARRGTWGRTADPAVASVEAPGSYMSLLDEAQLESVALDWFRGLGYAIAHGPALAPGEPKAERSSFGDVVLVERLRAANRAIATQEVIEELIALAKQLSEANQRGEKLGLSEEEIAFYDALATNDSAKKVMGDATLRVIATDLVTMMHKNVSIGWTLRESAQARMRVLVKRVLNKFGYPPDLQDAAVQEVLAQAARLCADWAAA